MQLEQIVVAALARCAEYGGSYPTARSVLYRRAAVRCGQLRALAAEWNPDLAATVVALPVDVDQTTGAAVVDLRAVAALSLLTLTVNDPGVSPYPVGLLVTVCDPCDPDSALPPRMVVEQGGARLRGLDASLEDVDELLLRYVPTPAALPETATADPVTVGLPAIAHELLVIDIARWCVMKATDLNPATAQAVVQGMAAEEDDLLGIYRRQTETFAPLTADRFARAVRQPDTLAASRS